MASTEFNPDLFATRAACPQIFNRDGSVFQIVLSGLGVGDRTWSFRNARQLLYQFSDEEDSRVMQQRCR